jgi:hypothetical protein
MQQATGLLSKISDSQYRLLTIEGEIILEGNLSLSDGFHSNVDLSMVAASERLPRKLVNSGIFTKSKHTSVGIESTDCPNDCNVPDDCSNPNDCDCDCAEP